MQEPQEQQTTQVRMSTRNSELLSAAAALEGKEKRDLLDEIAREWLEHNYPQLLD